MSVNQKCLLLFLHLHLVFLLANLHPSSSAALLPPPSVENPEFWLDSAKRDLLNAKLVHENVQNFRAKNAILFLGDGMGLPTVTSGRILKGQLAGTAGEQETLSFERFPNTALIKTYNTDMQTPDSAGTGTAFLCGVKARSATIGVNQNVDTKNCSSYNSQLHDVQSFLHEALRDGKSAGIVTTTRITHATPAAGYAHSVHRDWEDDADRNKDYNMTDKIKCPDIAQQLLSNAIDFTVVFGGGRKKFLPRASGGSRQDGQNLIDIWQQKQHEMNRRFKYLSSRQDLLDLNVNSFDHILGLFADSHLDYDRVNQQKPESDRQPTLEEMTRAAVKILQKNPKGFALLVEGGRIDHGHHDNRATMALHDLVAFDKAISSANQLTQVSDTLTIVTADHSHVFSVGGWANRGNPILGKVKTSYYGRFNKDGEGLADDNLPYTSLFYGDGPGAPVNEMRRNLTGVNTQSDEFLQSAIVPFEYESHGAEDVAAYARGPGSFLLHTTHEQSYIANVFKHSLCVGDYKRQNNCLNHANANAASAAFAAAVTVTSFLITRM